MKELPKIGYTEFNEYTYNLLKPYYEEWSLFHKPYAADERFDKVWWKIGKEKKEIGFCFQHSSPYYKQEELVNIKTIYECWI